MNETFLIAVIIALVGGFFTVLLTNRLGGQLEAFVAKLSQQWVQWPQRIFMGSGIIACVLIAVNYYHVQEFGQNIFSIIAEWEFFKQIPEPVRWFFRQLAQELAVLFDIFADAPHQTPLLVILSTLFIVYLFLSLFGVKWTQKYLFLLILAFALFFWLNKNFKNFNKDKILFETSWNQKKFLEDAFCIENRESSKTTFESQSG